MSLPLRGRGDRRRRLRLSLLSVNMVTETPEEGFLALNDSDHSLEHLREGSHL